MNNIDPTNDPRREMFICECSGESVMVSKYKDEPEIYFSFWGRGFNPKHMSWRMRLRLCWQILTTGTTYMDEVMLSTTKAREMSKFLSKITKG